MDRRAWWAIIHGGPRESDMTELLSMRARITKSLWENSHTWARAHTPTHTTCRRCKPGREEARVAGTREASHSIPRVGPGATEPGRRQVLQQVA